MKKIVIGFYLFGFCVISSYALASVATSFGLLFSGFAFGYTVLAAIIVSACLAVVVATFCKSLKVLFRWAATLISVVLSGVVVVGCLSYIQTKQEIKIFMAPVSVPQNIVVHNGRSIMFSSYVHFSGPAEKIAEIIKAKELAEVPAEFQESLDVSKAPIDGTSFSAREQTKTSWDWWQPTKMSNPKFYFRHHKSEAVQGWSEGWWVNDKTNEVYATIGG